VCSFLCDPTFAIQRFGGHPEDLEVSDFPFFAIFPNRSSCCLHARLLILAHLDILNLAMLRMSPRRVLPVTHFRVLNLHEGLLLLHLHLLIRPSPVFYPMCLFSCHVNIQPAHQRFGDHPGDLVVSDFPFFAILQAIMVHHGLSMIPAHLESLCPRCEF